MSIIPRRVIVDCHVEIFDAFARKMDRPIFIKPQTEFEIEALSILANSHDRLSS